MSLYKFCNRKERRSRSFSLPSTCIECFSEVNNHCNTNEDNDNVNETEIDITNEMDENTRRK